MKAENYKFIRRQLIDMGAFRVSNVYASLFLAVELSLLFAVIWGLTISNIFSIEFFLLEFCLAVLMLRALILLHECGHGAFFTNKKLNYLVGSILGVLAFIPFISWQHIHRGHHHWAGFADKDPSAILLLSLKNFSRLKLKLFNIVWRSWLPIPSIQFYVVVFWLYPFIEFRKKNYKLAAITFGSLILMSMPHILLLIFLGSRIYFSYILPSFVMYLFLYEIVNTPPHVGLYTQSSTIRKKPLRIYEQDDISRSSPIRPEWLSTILLFNFNLHIEHHLFPSLPFYNLPKARKIILEQKEVNYTDVPLVGYMLDIRKKNPADLYIKTLPPLG